MFLGPFDRRKRRHRCVACTKSHLKCSGNFPCTACVKRGYPCQYGVVVQERAILVDRGKHSTIGTYRGVGQSLVPDTLVAKPLGADQTTFYLSCFDAFLQKNKFTGLVSPREDIAELVKRGDPESHLRDAVLCLGAMQALTLPAASRSKEIRQFALQSYAKSISRLRDALANTVDDAESRVGILWSTLLLGLFELMNDSTGNGWLQHLIHGTSKALRASGPSTCISGPCMRFFTESKIFEVCRAVVFNQPTFLADEKWMALSASLRAYSLCSSQKVLDALLDIVVMCASLRVKAAHLIEFFQRSGPVDIIIEQAQAISQRGFELRGQLHAWASSHHTSNVFRCPATSQVSSATWNTEHKHETQLLAETCFSATSIYLSGVFDYEIYYWQSLQLPVATLSEDQIQQHVAFILDSSQRLAGTSISSLLLLFPLRVASARARKTSQKEQIMELLGIVGSSFPVALAFKAEIENLWRYNSAREFGSTTGSSESVGIKK
ncbi:hypothetical protein MCOR28_007782 [Pyricularia oryzae]|nr:hypothetical protein MCOR26_008773 [Pyricularia oryzae]KAI6338643.1 hypothetical protein MCOR28_007782 [Pyricularia oryzae]KAI6348844.1 hypothetical protein MCOR30_000110 [Pyricularia oryzae]KAI6601264.1 hypothetical protein MCOR12_004334 [Pyricularia oryzae]KAI6636999.1 hypothetical protein MCOR08_003359 [Pyricularia oryzae]